MFSKNAGFCYIFVLIVLVVSPPAFSSAQGQTGEKMNTECGYVFQEADMRQLLDVGWTCNPEERAIAEKMKKRGFMAKQFVEAAKLAHDIPRTTPKDIETVAVLTAVAINPRFYYMLDEDKRPTITQYYNVKLRRRGTILTAAGYSVAAVGLGLGIASAAMFAAEDSLDMGHQPVAANFLVSGPIALITGIIVGSLGVHKLTLISHNNALDRETMRQLQTRKTRTRHFAPDDLYEYLQAPPVIRIYGLAPIVGEDSFGLGIVGSF